MTGSKPAWLDRFEKALEEPARGHLGLEDAIREALERAAGRLGYRVEFDPLDVEMSCLSGARGPYDEERCNPVGGFGVEVPGDGFYECSFMVAHWHCEGDECEVAGIRIAGCEKKG